jgi:FkbM family methyltransferase
MLLLIKIYSKAYEFFHNKLKINLPGLGFLLRTLKKDQVISFGDKKLFFNHKISDNYSMLINSRFNEKETHYFLDNVFCDNQFYHFIEIGGNVGEFLIDYSDRINIKQVTVFEPQFEQLIALQKTIELNNFEKVNLIDKAVSDYDGVINFKINTNNTTASSIEKESNEGTSIACIKIDSYFKKYDSDINHVFLIDAEGAELDIIKGGAKFIKKHLPLIIFEYNHVSKKFFSLDEIIDELGNEYFIKRLRQDGLLDNDFHRTWNIVAIPNNRNFNHVKDLIYNG